MLVNHDGGLLSVVDDDVAVDPVAEFDEYAGKRLIFNLQFCMSGNLVNVFYVLFLSLTTLLYSCVQMPHSCTALVTYVSDIRF